MQRKKRKGEKTSEHNSVSNRLEWLWDTLQVCVCERERDRLCSHKDVPLSLLRVHPFA